MQSRHKNEACMGKDGRISILMTGAPYLGGKTGPLAHSAHPALMLEMYEQNCFSPELIVEQSMPADFQVETVTEYQADIAGSEERRRSKIHLFQ